MWFEVYLVVFLFDFIISLILLLDSCMYFYIREVEADVVAVYIAVVTTAYMSASGVDFCISFCTS